MLRIMPEWWMRVMDWLDHSSVPVMFILFFGTLYFLYAFWRDLRAIRRADREIRGERTRGT